MKTFWSYRDEIRINTVCFCINVYCLITLWIRPCA